ncbi:MAG: hypothetical protein AAF563_24185 [Pseudomonadota bacterium]
MKKILAAATLPMVLAAGLAFQASAAPEGHPGSEGHAAAHVFHAMHAAAADIRGARAGHNDIRGNHAHFDHFAEHHTGAAEGAHCHHCHPIIHKIIRWIKNHRHHPQPTPENHHPTHVNMHQTHDGSIDLFDFDENASIGWCEFGYMASDSPAKTDHIQHVLQQAADQAGHTLSDEECKAALTADPIAGAYLQGLFESADDNGNGMIEKGESADAIDTVMNAYDLNCDGTIDQADIDEAEASHVTMAQIADRSC